MRRFVLNIALLPILTLSVSLSRTTALAAAADDTASSKDKVVYQKKTIIDFSNVSIEGELRKPEGGYYGSRKKTRFNKLIAVRQNFLPEILSSTDNL